MATSAPASVEDLRRESDRNRADLTTTVSALKETVTGAAAHLQAMASPAYLKKEVHDYMRAERESMIDAVKRQVRENPLQAAAVGAALAYPALGIVRSIPTPLLLIGAGIWLTSARGKKALSEAQTTAAETFDRTRQTASEFVQSGATEMKARTQQLGDAARDGIAPGAGLLGELANQTASKVTDAYHDAKTQVAGAIDTVSSQATQLKDDASKKAGDIGQQASDMARSSGSSVLAFVQDHPLIIAGAATALGAFIAAALPGSEAENRMFGGSSDAVKDRARDAVSDTLNQAKTVVGEVVNDVSNAASNEGLDAAGLGKTTSGVISGMTAVAERGLNAALGADAPPIDADHSQEASLERNGP